MEQETEFDRLQGIVPNDVIIFLISLCVIIILWVENSKDKGSRERF